MAAELEIQQQIGTFNVIVRGTSVKDLLKQLAFFSEWPQHCPICGAPVSLFYRHPKDNDYYGMRCSGPIEHECNFGIHKVGDSLFYKGHGAWGVNPYSGQNQHEGEDEAGPTQGATGAKTGGACAWDHCGVALTAAQVTLSQHRCSGHILCPEHQKEYLEQHKPQPAATAPPVAPAPPPSGMTATAPSSTTTAPPATSGGPVSPPPASKPKPAPAPQVAMAPPGTISVTQQWVDHAFENTSILEEGEPEALTAELSDPAGITYDRCMAIFNDIKARVEADQGAAPA